MWKINYAVDEMKSIFLIWIFKLIISSIQMLIFHWRDRGLIDGEGPWKIAFFFFLISGSQGTAQVQNSEDY